MTVFRRKRTPKLENDIVGIHSDAVEGLRHAFREAVNDYFEAGARIVCPENPCGSCSCKSESPAVLTGA
ncbi:MAG: hypothetical protein OXD44_03235 [Gammaproteobacteria bacterium]|nr:hypothetical protein [Gammaproteobacteria bacterium]MCY4312706.1 hypothetical protein [Gammaproteobacteria bacterium]